MFRQLKTLSKIYPPAGSIYQHRHSVYKVSSKIIIYLMLADIKKTTSILKRHSKLKREISQVVFRDLY